jgi:hypothetical protein
VKKELKKKWVKALRSGKYNQTTSSLKDYNSYCCLGVLCEVAGLKFNEDGYYCRGLVAVDGGGLKATELKKFGLHHKTQSKLIDLNDEQHYNFNEIADYIEKNLKDS